MSELAEPASCTGLGEHHPIAAAQYPFADRLPCKGFGTWMTHYWITYLSKRAGAVRVTSTRNLNGAASRTSSRTSGWGGWRTVDGHCTALSLSSRLGELIEDPLTSNAEQSGLKMHTLYE